jgi:hypothetical protein
VREPTQTGMLQAEHTRITAPISGTCGCPPRSRPFIILGWALASEPLCAKKRIYVDASLLRKWAEKVLSICKHIAGLTKYAGVLCLARLRAGNFPQQIAARKAIGSLAPIHSSSDRIPA